MKKVAMTDYRNYIHWARRCTANEVYPLSIAEGFQSGDIFVNDGDTTESVLFWHCCGFGYISGAAFDAFLADIYKMFFEAKPKKRFVLITDDEKVAEFFRQKGMETEERYEYDYDEEKGAGDISYDKERFRIAGIDTLNITKIKGRIVPSFSWESPERFFIYGFGYVAMEKDEVCAVAFSSAVSSAQVDIGVETAENCRKNGLASALADQMCKQILKLGKKPTWAHAADNEGSESTALKCGFKKIKTNILIHKVVKE